MCGSGSSIYGGGGQKKICGSQKLPPFASASKCIPNQPENCNSSSLRHNKREIKKETAAKQNANIPGSEGGDNEE
jgi:hypothetical protein